MSPFLQVDQLSKRFGDLWLLDAVSFSISEGEKVGLIAPNGSGKSTLLAILTGEEPADKGSVTFQKGLRIGYLPQNPAFPPEITVMQACFASNNDLVTLIAAYEKAVTSDDHAKMDELIPMMDHLQAWDYEQRIKQILSELHITTFDQPVATLSGGQLKRLALANVLIAEPELLILDEPTNHLDTDMTEWLEAYLHRSKLSLLMVTHDRYFLDRVCNRILELDQRQMYSYKGNFSYYLQKREERINAQTVEIERANNLLRKELDWMRRQPQARATKAKSRIDAFYELQNKAGQQRKEKTLTLKTQASYIGNKIFEAIHVSKRYDALTILNDFNYVFTKYEKLGIVGNNGTGKSTFLKMLLGEVLPDNGVFEIGETVKFGYYSQEGIAFDEQMKVIDVVKNIAEVIDLGKQGKWSASQFLQHFLFEPERQYDFVYKLSGGEKRRLYLCTVLIQNPNFLILDEPTNDLDIVTLNVLESYLQEFQGCLIVVSHDRFFMDKVVDHLFIFEGNGLIQHFPGNYSDFREWKAKRTTTPKVIQNNESKTPKPQRTSSKKRLSFKEQKEFEQLEQEIEELEKEKQLLEASLSENQTDTRQLIALTERLAEVMRIIDDKSTRWLELSELASGE
ncbi:MAG: ABC-F family ATP-binding cassette domain-containing protein [Microbacter sp.]